MIDLTPLEVRKKKGDFRRQLRGYDPGQVDDFLDVVADRLEQLVRDNIGTAERLARLEQQVTEFRDREGAMTEALVTAQQMREQMQSHIVKEVELAKRQAVQDAERIRSDALQEVEREEENLARLRQRQRQLLQSFRSFLERELSELVVFSKGLEFEEAGPEGDVPGRRRSAGRSRFAAGRTATLEPDAAAEDERPAAPPSSPEPRPYRPPDAALPRAAAAPLAETILPAVAAPVEEPPHSAGAANPPAVPSAAEEGTAQLDPFGDLLDEAGGVEADSFVDPLATFMEPPPAVEDRPEAAEAAAPDAAAETHSGLGEVSEAEIGSLFTGWGNAPAARPDATEVPAEELEPDWNAEESVSDEAFLDELLMSEAELLLSDEDVLEDPVDDSVFEEVGGDDEAADFALEADPLVGELEAAESAPGDAPIDLSVLSDADEFADLNFDDLGLPPLPKANDSSVFGTSGLTLRPLPTEEEAPEVPRDRRDDDEDMFTSLFGKPR